MPCGAVLELGWLPVSKRVTRDATVDEHDHLEVEVRLLPVLGEERLGEVLREELEARGWVRRADGALTKDFGEATATLEAESSTVRLEVRGSRDVSVAAEARGRVRTRDDAATREATEADIEAAAAAKADGKLAVAAEGARREVVRENIEKLLEVQDDLRADVDAATSATTRRALKERAAQLGAIESVSEQRGDDGSLEVTIRVKT
ncbi:MAG: hypothetical protein AB1938_31945 [Myxococcota bacterium]